jgi:hypothetical protein
MREGGWDRDGKGREDEEGRMSEGRDSVEDRVKWERWASFEKEMMSEGTVCGEEVRWVA